jgi:capsular exopolysaccharide synthesis family protein
MDELEKRQAMLPLEMIPRGGTQALEAQQIVDVSSEEVPHLLDYWAIIKKRRWVVLSCLVIVFATVAIGTLKEKPVYEGKVLIEIDPEPPNVVNFKEVVSVSPVDVSAYLETQYKILKSRSLAERVVQDLQLYRLPEFYRARHLFGLYTTDPETHPSASDPNPDPNADYYRNSVSYVQNSIDVSPVRRSNLVQVSFDSYSPELAARIANKLSQDYIDQNLQVKWDETIKASKWLSGRLYEMKAKLEKSEDALQAYAQSHGILYIDTKDNSQQSMASARMEGLLQDYSQAQADMFQKQALYSLVQKGKIEDLPGVLNNGLIQALEEKVADEQQQYAMITSWVKPDYPKARQIQRQIKALQKQLDQKKAAIIENIVQEYKSAEHRVKYLQQAIDQQKRTMTALNQKLVQYNILKRQVDSNRELYQGLLQRMKEAQVSAGLNATNIRVVDTAVVPKSPVKPRVYLNLGLGVFLGLALGIGLAFFQEYLDKTLKTADDVERLVRLPSLGILPKFTLNGHHHEEEEGLVPVHPNGNGHLAPAIQNTPEVAEAFRSLRTSILLSASPVPKLLLITSALPSEGKTTTAVNLGAVLASLNTKVVIVDCDMRRPALHRSAGVENKPGFVQCLTGHVDLKDAILPVPGVPYLNAIPCGPIPPNPAEVLSSHMTGELLRRLRSEFEFVLVDSPPILSVADSRILATLTDAAILVTRAHSTSYDVVRRARSLLYGANARILGVALNDVDLRRDGDGYMSGNYGYGYGYGYGSNPDHYDDASDHT